jgi:putative metalloenzyme radical SAM/SPASM domain maturase
MSVASPPIDRAVLPRKLYVESTTRCNLRCPMCSKTIFPEAIPDRDMSRPVFSAVLEGMDQLEALVLNGIGEPLLHPDLPWMIASARARVPAQAWIGLQTNGTLLDTPLLDSLIAAGLNRLCLSLDALPQLGSRLGHPSQDAAQTGLQLVRQYCNRQQPAHFQYGVEIVVMRDNVDLLPDLVAQAATMGCSFCLVSHLLPYRADSEEQSLFDPNTSQARELFEQWVSDLQQSGIQIDSLLTAALQTGPLRPLGEHQQHFVTLRSQAKTRGLWLHLPNLIKWRHAPRPSWQQRFDQALEIARSHGLDLHLPPLSASPASPCRFVAEQAAFIGVDGTVMPCHALWHESRYHLATMEMQFSPQGLGNVAESSLDKVWQDQGFKAFHTAAHADSCPDCFNCGCGPCSDIAGTPHPFSNDCYGNTIPCGHCPWLLGGFRCL